MCKQAAKLSEKVLDTQESNHGTVLGKEFRRRRASPIINLTSAIYGMIKQCVLGEVWREKDSNTISRAFQLKLERTSR